MEHLIGLLLGTEDDWSTTFERLMEQLGPIRHGGEEHVLRTERVTIEPFDLRARARHTPFGEKSSPGTSLRGLRRPCA